MATRAEFEIWLGDFQKRFPAVAGYIQRNGSPELIETWQRSLQAFEVDTLYDATKGMIDGSLSPVDNTKLGTFGDEMRQRCRDIIEQKRRSEPVEHYARQVLDSDRSQQMLGCGKAMLAVCEQRNIPTAAFASYCRQGRRMDLQDPYDCAVVLADKHTDAEHAEAMATLDRHGILWADVVDGSKDFVAEELI